jgi:hypothetical protein
LIAIHLPPEQRRVKPYYEVYRPAGSKGVQTCGPKGDKSTIKRGKSQKKTKKTSKSRLQVGEWAIFLTNVPVEQMTAQEALVIMRCRWQIEVRRVGAYGIPVPRQGGSRAWTLRTTAYPEGKPKGGQQHAVKAETNRREVGLCTASSLCMVRLDNCQTQVPV